MPTRPPSACADPRCPNTRPCPDHPARTWADRKMPPGWARTRAAILRRDPTCRLCRLAPSAEVHHTVQGSEDPATIWGVCSACHLVETQRQAAAARAAAR